MVVIYLVITSINNLALWLAGLSAGPLPGIGLYSVQSLWYALRRPGMGKLNCCGRALACWCTGTPCTRVLQHMATLAGTKARWKPPRASHKRRVPWACQLLHSGEEHSMDRMCRSYRIQLMEQKGWRTHAPSSLSLLMTASAHMTAPKKPLGQQRGVDPTTPLQRLQATPWTSSHCLKPSADVRQPAGVPMDDAGEWKCLLEDAHGGGGCPSTISPCPAACGHALHQA